MFNLQSNNCAKSIYVHYTCAASSAIELVLFNYAIRHDVYNTIPVRGVVFRSRHVRQVANRCCFRRRGTLKYVDQFPLTPCRACANHQTSQGSFSQSKSIIARRVALLATTNGLDQIRAWHAHPCTPHMSCGIWAAILYCLLPLAYVHKRRCDHQI